MKLIIFVPRYTSHSTTSLNHKPPASYIFLQPPAVVSAFLEKLEEITREKARDADANSPPVPFLEEILGDAYGDAMDGQLACINDKRTMKQSINPSECGIRKNMVGKDGGLDRVKIVAYDRFTKSTKHPRVAGSWLSKIYLPLSNADKYRPFENNFTVICLGEIETEAFQSLADIRAR